MNHPWSIAGSFFTKYEQLLLCVVSIFIKPSTHKKIVIIKMSKIIESLQKWIITYKQSIDKLTYRNI